MHVTPARRPRDSPTGPLPVAALVGQEGPREHNRTAIKKLHFSSPSRYTILSNQRNCMKHPSQRERQPSHKQSRRRCWCPLLSTTLARLSGVGGGIIRSYNLKNTLLSSSMVVLLLSTFSKALY